MVFGNLRKNDGFADIVPEYRENVSQPVELDELFGRDYDNMHTDEVGKTLGAEQSMVILGRR